MAERADVVFYQNNDWTKIGEVEVAEDGTITGKIQSKPTLPIVECIGVAKQPYVVALSLLPALAKYPRVIIDGG